MSALLPRFAIHGGTALTPYAMVQSDRIKPLGCIGRGGVTGLEGVGLPKRVSRPRFATTGKLSSLAFLATI